MAKEPSPHSNGQGREGLVQQLGRYQLIERLGVGGMAEIFLARYVGENAFEKRYVLKLLHGSLSRDPNFVRLLVEEARLAAQFSHANIAQTYDLCVEGETTFMVMEHVDGLDLLGLIKTCQQAGKTWPMVMAAFVAHETCAGLHYAHSLCDAEGRPYKLVHRDISPHNILVSRQGEVKVIDFGIAKIQSEMREQTRAGVIKGKFSYMSPEQAWNHPLDARSDVFAVGLVLYELLTGRPAYESTKDMLAMLNRVREAKPTPASELRPEIPADLQRLLDRALAADPQNRYPSALALQRDLGAWLAGSAPGFHRLDLAAFLYATGEAAAQAPAGEAVSAQLAASPLPLGPAVGPALAKSEEVEHTNSALLPEQTNPQHADGLLMGEEFATSVFDMGAAERAQNRATDSAQALAERDPDTTRQRLARPAPVPVYGVRDMSLPAARPLGPDDAAVRASVPDRTDETTAWDAAEPASGQEVQEDDEPTRALSAAKVRAMIARGATPPPLDLSELEGPARTAIVHAEDPVPEGFVLPSWRVWVPIALAVAAASVGLGLAIGLWWN